MSLAKSIDNLPSKLLQEVMGVIEEDLNSTKEKLDSYDPSLSFRTKLIKKFKFRIKTLFAVYYQGWECDMWAARVEDESGKTLFVSTNHGQLNIEDTP